ncbi:MAG TPA: NAD(P)/FAD-dependent oxidoreductase [Oculatellaceae cyanobacterium]
MSGQPGKRPHVVIVGGGFGGLYAAKMLGNQPVDVTLIDKRNFHLFQPLLYQVATGSLSPGDISAPLRDVLRNFQNIRVLLDEMVDIVPEQKQIKLKHRNEQLISYDLLILATGSATHYFGHDQWATHTHGLKTVEEALDMRRQILSVFEEAETEPDPERRETLMTFAIIGGGPTGVELAGAIAQLAHYSLDRNFRNINPKKTRILLIEGGPRLLAVYPEELSASAERTLVNMGVEVRTKALVTEIGENCITLKVNDKPEFIRAGSILWAAGVKASSIGRVVADRFGLELDRSGRIPVEADCSIAGHPEILVLGDLANFSHTPDGKPLPGVAPVAIQQGKYAAKTVLKRLRGEPVPPFKYFNKGNLAVIGLREAVADIWKLRLSGLIAWFIWAFVHIRYLIGFDNKLIVMLQWFWTYFTRQHGARLITGPGFYD